jgi:hypothetical protein
MLLIAKKEFRVIFPALLGRSYIVAIYDLKLNIRSALILAYILAHYS